MATSRLATQAFAVFEPGDDPADVSTGDLTWVDETDKVTNTATHGPQGWLVDTVWRDQRGNTTRVLDGAGWARVQQAEPEERPSVAADASSFTVFNTWGGEEVAGTLVVDSYGPATTATLDDGTTGMFRTHTHYVYDNTPEVDAGLVAGRPGEATGGLVVQAETSAAEPDLSADHDRVLTRYDYNPVVAGDGNGWQLGTPVTTRQQDGSGWATSVTRTNPAGQVIETQRPGGQVDATGAGADALSTTTSYYTADGAGACGGKPAWAGQVCATGPAAQPASGPPVPTTRFVSYTQDGQPGTVVEESGASTRTTTSTYDALGRVVAQSKQFTGADVVADGFANTIAYTDQGAVKTVTTGAKSVSTGYDSWGRTTTSTDAVGTVSHTAYTAAGQVASFDDSAATYAYSYGPRGELTGVAAGGGVGSFSYAYTRGGQIGSVTYPNGMAATRDYTETGVPVGLDYTQGEDAVASFTAQTDVAGRTIGQTSTGSTQEFKLDDLGRLTRTRDWRAGQCLTRTYGFDAASNRTSTKIYGAGAEGVCRQDTATVDRSHGYDSAGRIREPGYSYDTFGRTLTLPGVDAATPGSTGVQVAYGVDDMVASLTQTIQDDTTDPAGSSTSVMTYGLDPARRVQTITTKIDGTETQRLRYRFAGGGDSPAVVETSTDQGASWKTTRYMSVPEVGMAASVTGAVESLQVANLHGDVVATLPAATGSAALDSWTETDEYGNPVDHAAEGEAPTRYGYLGTHQRATDTPGGGLALMGARLYNAVTGTFLSPDPVPGGNVTAYTYPQNPSSEADTTGKYLYEMNYNKCASLGCLWMRRLCSTTNQYCSFQWGYRFSNPLRLATAVNMFVSFYVSGHRVGTYKKTTQNGRYWFHGSWLSNNKAFKYGGFMGIGGSVGHLRPWSKIELIFQGSVYGVPGMPYAYFTGRGLWNPKNP